MISQQFINSIEKVLQMTLSNGMASGAAFPKGFRAKAIQAGKDDEWAKEREERRIHVEDYMKKVKNHRKGRQTFLENKGLMEKIASAMGAAG